MNYSFFLGNFVKCPEDIRDILELDLYIEKLSFSSIFLCNPRKNKKRQKDLKLFNLEGLLDMRELSDILNDCQSII